MPGKRNPKKPAAIKVKNTEWYASVSPTGEARMPNKNRMAPPGPYKRPQPSGTRANRIAAKRANLLYRTSRRQKKPKKPGRK